MSTTKNFPVFKASLEATCFKCGEKLAPRTIAFTHNAPGLGQWVGSCDKCDLRTWFDIKIEDSTNDELPIDPADHIEYEDRQEVLRSMGRVRDDQPEDDGFEGDTDTIDWTDSEPDGSDDSGYDADSNCE